MDTYWGSRDTRQYSPYWEKRLENEFNKTWEMSGKCEPGYKVHYSHTAGRFSVHSHFSMVAPCNALRKKSWSLAVTDIYLSFIYHIPCSLCLPVNSCGASKRYHYQPLPRWSWKEGGKKKYAHEAWWSKNNSSQERTAHAHTQTYKGGRNDAAVGKRREQVWPTCSSAVCGGSDWEEGEGSQEETKDLTKYM